MDEENFQENEGNNDYEEYIERPWELVIHKISNGFLIGNPNHDSIDTFNELAIVEDEKESDDSMVQAKLMKEMIYNIAEYFGTLGNKHNRFGWRVQILDLETDKEIEELKEKVKSRVYDIIKKQKIEEGMEKKVQELSNNTKVEKYYDRIK